MPKSTISTFLKNKETIKVANVAKGSKVSKNHRLSKKLLLVFMNEKQLKGDSFSEVFISEKALSIYGDLSNLSDLNLGIFVKIIRTLTSKQAEFGSKSLEKEVELTIYLDMERRQVQTIKSQRRLRKNSVTT